MCVNVVRSVEQGREYGRRNKYPLDLHYLSIALTGRAISQRSGDVAELVDARDLKSRAFSSAYGFESHHPHQVNGLKIPRSKNSYLHPIQILNIVHSFQSAVFICPQLFNIASLTGRCLEFGQLRQRRVCHFYNATWLVTG